MYLTRYIEPEAVGYLIAEYIRCGKPGCRCENGRKHGPYWYLHYRRLEKDKWWDRKRYVPINRLNTVRRWLEGNKARDRAFMSLLRQSEQLRAALRQHRMGKINDIKFKEICNEIQRKTE